MVGTALAASAVAATTTASSSSSSPAGPSRPRPHPRPRAFPSRSTGSFHAGEPFPQLSPYDEGASPKKRRTKSTAAPVLHPLRRQSTHRYHTFPTPPPKTPSEQQPHPKSPDTWRGSQTSYGNDGNDDGDDESTPLPWKQLGLLALLSLAEQTALNSIGPYLPTMVASFDEIPDGQEGLYVGLLASAFALAQLATNLFWGYLSDRIGRKPVMLLGTALLMGCFICFGFCATFVQLLLVHIAMGLLNGNAAVVPTCLGEVTDRTNQSRAFTWLPVMYSLGSITGPALGGLLVGEVGGSAHPFLAPNLLGAGLLLASVVILAIWFDETLEGPDGNPAGLGWKWLGKLCSPCTRCLGRKTERRDENSADESQALLDPHGDEHASAADDAKLTDSQKSAFRQLYNRTTLTVLMTYLVFQLTNISFNSLYPIFASASPPTGRQLGPGTIGLSLSLAGLVTILFQLFAFQPLKARLGNLGTYRYSLLGLAVSMALMPWIGRLDGEPLLGLGSARTWLFGELGIILVLKNICAVGGLSSVMLLINNSAPSHETLGTLNGIAQTLSAAGRSFGPFLSGGLFTLSMRIRPKGEALAWGIFAGVALMGFVGTLFIRGKGLESADWMGNDSEESEGASDDEEDAIGVGSPV
ncbi:major facilitator superfamily domain-containing protein [Podospora conica]|nr:major facilitator superfamily domain-containing protein [Schizothecium conicum]